MTSGNDPTRVAVLAQAGDWYVANQSGAIDPAECAAFIKWLKSSPMHVEEYLGVALIARDLPPVTGESALSVEALVEQARADVANGATPFERATVVAARSTVRPRWAGRWRTAATLAATLLLVVGLTWRVLDTRLFGDPLSFETARGDQRAWRLADGSQLRLNTDSAATVRYTRKERFVELLKGQAHFQVAHDETRRFRVAAGDVGAIATGTQFDVYRQRTTTIVTVSDGEVVVFTGQPPRLGRDHPQDRAQQVHAGYQLRIDAELASAQPVTVDLGQSLAWLQHKIAFDHRPLGEVADEFNRYAHVPLDIADPALRAYLVSGVFETDDLESFVAFLETLEGVRVERTPKKILVLRRGTDRNRKGATGSQR